MAHLKHKKNSKINNSIQPRKISFQHNKIFTIYINVYTFIQRHNSSPRLTSLAVRPKKIPKLVCFRFSSLPATRSRTPHFRNPRRAYSHTRKHALKNRRTYDSITLHTWNSHQTCHTCTHYNGNKRLSKNAISDSSRSAAAVTVAVSVLRFSYRKIQHRVHEISIRDNLVTIFEENDFLFFFSRIYLGRYTYVKYCLFGRYTYFELTRLIKNDLKYTSTRLYF